MPSLQFVLPFFLYHLSQSFCLPFFQDFVFILLRSLYSHLSFGGLHSSFSFSYFLRNVSIVIPRCQLSLSPIHLIPSFFPTPSIFPVQNFSLRCPVCGPVPSFFSFQFFHLSPLTLAVSCYIFLVPGGVTCPLNNCHSPFFRASRSASAILRLALKII